MVVPWPEPCHTLTGYWYTAGWDSRTGKWYAKCYLGHVLRGRTGRDTALHADGGDPSRKHRPMPLPVEVGGIEPPSPA